MRYDQPDEEFINDPEDILLAKQGAAHKSARVLEELRAVRGISDATRKEFDDKVFASLHPDLLRAIDPIARRDKFSEANPFVKGVYKQGRRLAPVLLCRESTGSIQPHCQQKVEWLACYLRSVAKMNVEFIDLWEVLDACGGANTARMYDWSDAIARKNSVIIFNDMYLNDEPNPWGGDSKLSYRVQSLFRSFYERGGSFLMVVDCVAGEFPSGSDMGGWWGAVAGAMVDHSVMVKI